MNYNFGKLGILVCMAHTSQQRHLPKDFSYLLSNALSSIDSPESLAEFEKVVGDQMSTMKQELVESNKQLGKYEQQFKKDLESIDKETKQKLAESGMTTS